MSLFVSCLSNATFTHATGRIEILARTGDQAPDRPTGETIFSVDTPMINNLSSVAFKGKTQTQTTQLEGLWLNNEVIAFEEEQAGSLPSDVLIDRFGPTYTLNDNDQVAYEALLKRDVGGVDGTNDQGIWLNQSLKVRRGDIAAGTSGQTFVDIGSRFTINNTGQLAFSGSVRAEQLAPRLDGIWTTTSLIALEGLQAPGTSTGTLFLSNINDPQISQAGDIAFESRLEIGTGDVTSQNDWGVWRNSTLIARKGQAAPGLGGAVLHGSFSAPQTNSSGDLLFSSFFQYGSGGVTADSDASLWRNNTLIMREGSVAPGTIGALFDRAIWVLFNNSSDVAYHARLKQGTGGVSSSDDVGLWINNSKVFREGEQVPTMPNGVIFGESTIHSFNNQGHIVVRPSFLIGSGGISTDNSGALFIIGPGNEFVKVLQKGDDVDGRVFNLALFATGVSGGRGRGINDLGQIAFKARYADGSEDILLYTPDLYWKGGSSTNWSDRFNWTISQVPASVHHVIINPDFNLLLNAPSADFEIRQLTLGGGTGNSILNLLDSTITVPHGVQLLSNGTLVGGGIIAGPVDNDGEINVPPGQTLTIQGSVSGTGSYTGGGEKIFGADLANGESTEVTNIDGDVILSADGNVEVNFDNDTADRFDVSGNLHINGGLTLKVGSSFIISANQTFRIFDAASISNEFSTIDLSEAMLPDGFTWDFSSLYTNGEVTIVEVPLAQQVPVPIQFRMLLALAISIVVVSTMHRPSSKH